MRTRHEFLAALHDELQPENYLEIGVQFGTSLRLTLPSCNAVGVDPEPLCTPPPNAQLMTMTSDEFFRSVPHMHNLPWGKTTGSAAVDFAFIDGMHLVEYALRDFINTEELCHADAVITLDDVIPYSPDIAGRDPLPGDWAGDVWKLRPILAKWRPELKITMVDVEPTGLMVVQGLDPHNGPQVLRAYYDEITSTWARDVEAQEWLSVGALRPDQALREIKEYRA